MKIFELKNITASLPNDMDVVMESFTLQKDIGEEPFDLFHILSAGVENGELVLSSKVVKK